MGRLSLTLVLIGAIIVTGCAPTVTREPHVTTYVSNYCDLSSPILLLKSEVDLLSRESQSQILIHNKTWASECRDKKN